MDFLRKAPEIKWRTFLLTIFLVAYGVSTITVLGMYGQLEAVGLLLGVLVLTSLVMMTFAFGVSRLAHRMDVVDMMWGIAIMVVATASFIANPYGVQIGLNIQTLATGLVLIWGARLSYYIARRLLRSGEDRRYQELRDNWRGNPALNAYLRVFVVQAVLAVIIASAVICINRADEVAIGVIAWTGLAVWVFGFLFESIGDMQLKRFLANSKKKDTVMTAGLWRYTRHPNYFGEATQWWGLCIIALSVPFGWMGILSPVIITYLLLYVSGVPLAEKRAESKRGWKTYAKRTSMFVPWPPASK